MHWIFALLLSYISDLNAKDFWDMLRSYEPNTSKVQGDDFIGLERVPSTVRTF